MHFDFQKRSLLTTSNDYDSREKSWYLLIFVQVKERSTAELQKAEEEDEKEEENQGKYNEIQTYR